MMPQKECYLILGGAGLVGRQIARRIATDDALAPRAERALAEPAAEPFHPGDADALQLARVAVENHEARAKARHNVLGNMK